MKALAMNYVLKYFLLWVFTLTTFSSCMEDVDVGQLDDLDITPTLEASLLYVEASERAINLVNDTTVFSNDFNFDAFNSEVFANRAIEGTITYVVENTTSKELDISIAFLNDDGLVLDTEVFAIQPSPTAILQREIVYGPSGRSLDIITNLSSIRVSAVNLSDNTSTSTVDEAMISLKSSAKFTVRVK